MLKGGLRVTEVVRLQVKDFDFNKKAVIVRSLKKRRKADSPIVDEFRHVPLTSDILQALAEYWITLKKTNPSAYIFPSNSESGHISRNAVWKMLKKYDVTIHPHMLRHTFATKIVSNGNSLQVAKELLGHRSERTTEIYVHVAKQELEAAIKTLEPVPNFAVRFYRKFFPKKETHILHVERGRNEFIVGRKKELELLHSLCMKKVNVLIIAPKGGGKTQMMDNLKFSNILRIDEFTGVKKTLGGMLLELFNGDKEALKQMMFDQEKEFEKQITKGTIKYLTDLLKKITQRHEYTIVVDNIETVTPSGVRALEALGDHFHFVMGARKVQLSKATFLTTFDKMILKPLPRIDCIRLIDILSKDFANSIEDYDAYRNKIVNESSGNAGAITEMVDRFSKEPFVSAEMVAQRTHNSELKEVDMTIVVIIALSSLMILRYYGKENDESSMTFIGGFFMVFALFARTLMRGGTRKYI